MLRTLPTNNGELELEPSITGILTPRQEGMLEKHREYLSLTEISSDSPDITNVVAVVTKIRKAFRLSKKLISNIEH